MPVIRVSAIAFIELFRSVPLITVLFMAVTMMPLFLPADVQLNKLVQVIIGICLFAAAYMAEVVRGGLQAVPNGQYEAAKAMGLTYWKSMNLIILPQALKLMIPNIVGNFIGNCRMPTGIQRAATVNTKFENILPKVNDLFKKVSGVRRKLTRVSEK